MDIKGAISAYLDHLQDPRYLLAIVKSPEKELFRNLAEMLIDSQQSYHADLFIRDVFSHVPRTKTRRFRKMLYRSEVGESYRKNCVGPDFVIRQNSIDTLAHYGFPEALHTLINAFKYASDRDPLLMPLLVSDVISLSDWHGRRLMHELRSSDLYLMRWSVLAVLEHRHLPLDDKSAFLSRKAFLKPLLNDDDLLVQAQARWLFEETRFERSLNSLSKQEKRWARKDLNARKPALCFDDIGLLFSHVMHRNGRADYLIDELDAFVQSLRLLLDGEKLFVRNFLYASFHPSLEWKVELKRHLEQQQSRVRFLQGYREMMQDTSMPFTHKALIYTGKSLLTEEEALQFLENIWKTVSGKNWQWS